MTKPRPVPPKRRVIDVSTCEKLLNKRSKPISRRTGVVWPQRSRAGSPLTDLPLPKGKLNRRWSNVEEDDFDGEVSKPPERYQAYVGDEDDDEVEVRTLVDSVGLGNPSTAVRFAPNKSSSNSIGDEIRSPKMVVLPSKSSNLSGSTVVERYDDEKGDHSIEEEARSSGHTRSSSRHSAKFASLRDHFSGGGPVSPPSRHGSFHRSVSTPTPRGHRAPMLTPRTHQHEEPVGVVQVTPSLIDAFNRISEAQKHVEPPKRSRRDSQSSHTWWKDVEAKAGID